MAEPSPLLDSRAITFLYTDDLPRLAAFYGEVLGLPLVMDQGGARIYRASDGGFVGVCDFPHRPRGTKGVMLTFVVEDVDAVHAALSARGVGFDGPPRNVAGDTIRCAFFRDPEGYALEIQTFLSPDWPYPPNGRGA